MPLTDECIIHEYSYVSEFLITGYLNHTKNGSSLKTDDTSKAKGHQTQSFLSR